ncbi:MAG: hypothetical protein PF692_14405 [Kiritimatiellae bacterium]|jgi:hypothetical protein|nr:hypothetical protein [Kiritimatiellia bacterium]
MSLDISIYTPGRFSYLMNEPFAEELWNFISDETQIEKMTLATAQGLPAIEFFLNELEMRFDVHLKSENYPKEDVGILANNMIKQVMQHNGYVYTACGLCPAGKYIKMSGVYTTPE